MLAPVVGIRTLPAARRLSGPGGNLAETREHHLEFIPGESTLSPMLGLQEYDGLRESLLAGSIKTGTGSWSVDGVYRGRRRVGLQGSARNFNQHARDRKRDELRENDIISAQAIQRLKLQEFLPAHVDLGRTVAKEVEKTWLHTLDLTDQAQIWLIACWRELGVF